MQEYTHGAKYNWMRPGEYNHLTEVLHTEFPDCKYANYVEDFNGQIIYTRETAIAFRTSEDATQFILKYGERFGMTPTTDLWYDVRPL